MWIIEESKRGNFKETKMNWLYRRETGGESLIQSTRSSLVHRHSREVWIFDDILIVFSTKEKEREREREKRSEIVGPRRVTFKSTTSADVGFLAVPRCLHVCQRASLMKCSNAMPSNNSVVSRLPFKACVERVARMNNYRRGTTNRKDDRKERRFPIEKFTT